MPPTLPKGQRYVPVNPDPAAPLPVPGAPASFSDPEPEGLRFPAAAFPQASGTTLSTPGYIYPAPGPTSFDFIYQQLQKAAFPGTANTWTAVQQFTGSTGPLTSHTLTDTGGGSDSPSLRPSLATLDHFTTATAVPGVGGSLTFRAQDSAAAIVNVARVCGEVTGITPGSVDGTLALVVMHQGQECEVARARAQLGKDATVDSTGVYGYLGGEFWCRTYLRVQERFGMNGVTPVGVQTLPAAASDPTTTQALANAIRTALIAFGLAQ